MEIHKECGNCQGLLIDPFSGEYDCLDGYNPKEVRGICKNYTYKDPEEGK